MSGLPPAQPATLRLILGAAFLVTVPTEPVARNPTLLRLLDLSGCRLTQPIPAKLCEVFASYSTQVGHAPATIEPLLADDAGGLSGPQGDN